MRQQNGQNGHRRHNNNRGGNRHGGGGNHSGGNNGGGMRRNNNTQVPLRNQIFDSHGPENTRVRGNAFQAYEKYMTLAREAPERIDAENYFQHAEHYYRIVEAIQEHEAEQRTRFAPEQQPGSGEQPPMSQGPTDPFAPVSTANESDTGLTDLAPAEAANR